MKRSKLCRVVLHEFFERVRGRCSTTPNCERTRVFRQSGFPHMIVGDAPLTDDCPTNISSHRGSFMPPISKLVEEFFRRPLPGSTEVRVSGEIRRGFGLFGGQSIPIDLRSYILYAD